MLGIFESIGTGILDLPFVLINLVVALVNAVIAAFAAIGAAALSLLPGFPSPPSAPGGVVGALLWFFPLGTVLSFFGLMVTAWVAFLGVKAALNWARVL
ncbi:MAG: hypothetical protein J0H06_11325 [Actinobacteria bacterium]|nr:hypothetical protein [Actinomycetota bacterium]OJU85738.1 MAG: hypothetical protein BGO11_11835 [Solirubrobacterales bacterium 70-9]